MTGKRDDATLQKVTNAARKMQQKMSEIKLRNKKGAEIERKQRTT
jgi:hypothetical protein